MRFKEQETFVSQDGKLQATVVAIHDGGRSGTFRLESGEEQLVNYDFVWRGGYWRKT